MARPEKVKKVEEAKKCIEENCITIVADYRGLDVAQVSDLRKKLREGDTSCKVFKNTFVKIALDECKVEFDEQLLKGPSMFIFGKDDPVFPAKVLSQFAKENEALTIKGGILDNKGLSMVDITGLAKLPSREELLGKLVGTLNAPIQGIVNVLAGPARNLVTVLDAVKKQKEEQQ